MINWLAENALPIWVCGAIALTMAAIVYQQTRTNGSLLAVAIVIGITGLLLLAEHLMETPREAVERSLYELAAVVEKNDVAGALTFLSPTANMNIRHDVETLMPLVNIERARILGTPKIEVDESDGAASAVVTCRGLIIATIKKNGMKGGQDDQLTMNWIRQGDRWLVDSYTSKRNWPRALGR